MVKLVYLIVLYVSLLSSFLLSPFRLIRKVVSHKRINSLWTGTPIINMAINAKAERLLGVNSKSLVYGTFYITNKFDYDLGKWRSRVILRDLIPFFVFLWACIFVDRLHFYCDKGLLPSLNVFGVNRQEFVIYKIFGIDVFFWTYGADVRTKETTWALGEPNCCTYCDKENLACICDDRRRQVEVEFLHRYSRAIFSMGDMTEYTPGSIDDLYFWPVDIYGEESEKYNPEYPSPKDNFPIRVVHAPNHRQFKGTDHLISAINELKDEGVNIELVLVEKMPNAEALEIYKTADIIFDQCLIGFHGYFANEGMAMGKPVMCFIRKPEKYLIAHGKCPIINTNINTLKGDLRLLADNPEMLAEIGKKSRSYIEKYYTLEAFSLRLRRAYEKLGVNL